MLHLHSLMSCASLPLRNAARNGAYGRESRAQSSGIGGIRHAPGSELWARVADRIYPALVRLLTGALMVVLCISTARYFQEPRSGV